MKRLLSIATAALTAATALAFCIMTPPIDATAEDALVWDDEIYFDSEEEVREKFVAHFCSSQNERRADDLSYSWRIDDGTLLRTNNVDPARDTVNIAVLTYTGNTYDDFELSVDYKMGNKTIFWPVVGIRQQIPGKYYTSVGGGAGVFMQDNGKITMWGPILGGLQEYSIPGAGNYAFREWHNMRILAVGKAITVWIDGVEVYTFSVNSTDYIKGYISLQSVNNDCRFDNFKIRAIGTADVAENEPNRGPNASDGTPLDDYIK